MKIKGGVALASNGEGGSAELEAGMKKLRKSWAGVKEEKKVVAEAPKPVEAKKKKIAAYEPVKLSVAAFVTKHLSE